MTYILLQVNLNSVYSSTVMEEEEGGGGGRTSSDAMT